RKAVKNAPDAVDNYVRLIGLLRQMDRGQLGEHFQEAEGHLAAALARAPDNAALLVTAAELAQDRGELAQAREGPARPLKVNAAEERAHLVLARLELRAGKRGEAVAALRRGLRAVPRGNRFELYWALANVLIDGGELEQAREVVARVQDLNPSPGATDYLQ